jgi:predicted MPP superfamily phosphohydrolase
MHTVMQPSEMVVLVFLLAAQTGIVLELWNRLRAKLSRAGAGLFWITVLAVAAIGLCGIFLGITREFGPRFRDIRTAAFLWLLPSAPGFLLYLLYRRIVYRRTSAPASGNAPSSAPSSAPSNAPSNAPSSPDRRILLHAAGMAAVATPFAVEGWGVFVTRLNFRVEEVDLPVADLHQDLEGLRVLHLSDVHMSKFLSERDFARVVDAANELRPQVALMTGDLISSWGDPLDACISQLSRIKADAPMLGCLGNHETYAQVERYTEEQAAKKGITFLRGARRELKFGRGVLNIAGIDYQPFTLRGRYLREAAPLVIPGAANLLLSHNPDVFQEAPEQGWQAMLAGHTHGGQVTLEILSKTINPARFLTKYVTGLYVERGAACYVTRGIGTIGIPARVGATPEITFLRLRKSA